MTRSSLTQFLLQSVSLGALELGMSLQQESSKSSQTGELVVAGLLGRIRFWLHLLFVGMRIRHNSEVTSVYYLRDEPRNRHFSHLRRRETPLAHRTYALGHILIRRWGYAHFCHGMPVLRSLDLCEEVFVGARISFMSLVSWRFLPFSL